MAAKVTDNQHIPLSYVTHFYCNQNNICSVESLLREYEKMSPDLLKVIEFVIVDDCSSIEYEIPHFKLNITWLHLDDDIPWNQGDARNLGVTYAKADKILVTDLDHIVPEHTFNHLIHGKNLGRDFFKIYRRSGNKIIKGHSNMFFMSLARFLRFWGYDEEYSGDYGSEDYRFVKFQKYHGSRQRYLPKNFYCMERDIDREKSYHSLTRDLSNNTPIDARKHQEINTYGYEKGHSRAFLNFKWHIEQVFTLPVPDMKVRRFWRKSWWLRYLLPILAR